MNRKNTQKLFPDFVNYTDEMYIGNMPCRNEYNSVTSKTEDIWTHMYGTAKTIENKVVYSHFNINSKITINIIGNMLWIIDIRYIGKSDFWEYSNNNKINMPSGVCCSEKSRHSLEDERIEKILDTKISNCEIWNITQKRAKDLYAKDEHY